jgi:hypothetical protein
MTEFARWLGEHNADTMLSDLLREARTEKQARAVWTTYCLLMGLEPDTKPYDNMLLTVWNEYWSFGVNKRGLYRELSDYDVFDLFMGELLC